MIVVTARFTLKPGVLEAYLKEAAPLIEATRKEDGCLSYVLHQDLKSPDSFAVIEQWRDEAALDAHFQTAHVKAIAPKLNALRVAPPEVTRFKPVA
ncbi:MAG: antibiotic biosynthesis monooxygenase [Spirochaetes bacterium]|nr:antibiotic biosynthesis monooxygenase [Spirochaetota bacterium]